jgi:hypothetical protein
MYQPSFPLLRWLYHSGLLCFLLFLGLARLEFLAGKPQTHQFYTWDLAMHVLAHLIFYRGVTILFER